MYKYIQSHNINISMYNIIVYIRAMGFMERIDKERGMSKLGWGSGWGIWYYNNKNI